MQHCKGLPRRELIWIPALATPFEATRHSRTCTALFVSV
jgi:hypothetical protein